MCLEETQAFIYEGMTRLLRIIIQIQTERIFDYLNSY